VSKELRMCFVGDSLLLGTNDDNYLGWPGRLCRREHEAGHDVSLYNLGIRADTSEKIAARWRHECQVRLPETSPGALVFSFGANDCADLEGFGRRVPLERSIAVARGMLESAAAWKPTLWIGPPPVDDSRQPFRAAPSVVYHFPSSRIGELSGAYAEVAASLDIPYFDLYRHLINDPAWPGMYEKNDGVHPIAAGYDIVGEHIFNWDAWRTWFD